LATLRQIQASAFTLTIALLAASPGAADEAAVAVDGTVTVNGQPLADGIIIFHLDDNEFVGTKVKDGRYRVTRVPAGEWRVTLRSDKTPERFASEDTSGLRVAVKPGKNTLDFDLKKR
jgi:hypothetical protein